MKNCLCYNLWVKNVGGESLPPPPGKNLLTSPAWKYSPTPCRLPSH